MSRTKFSRAGMPWTMKEHRALIRSYDADRTYSEIASLAAFRGKRSTKSLRRRMERIEFGIS